MMKTRQWNPAKDYPLAVGWWEERQSPAGYIPSADFLPRAGFVVEQGGDPLCMGWLYYYLDVAGAQLGYLVTNPANRPSESRDALTTLIRRVNALADEQGLRLVGRYSHAGIVQLLESAGWETLEAGQVALVRMGKARGQI